VFHFEIEQENIISLILFFDDLDSSDKSLAEVFEKTYQNYHRPDQIICILPCSDENTFINLLADSSVKINAERYGAKVPFTALTFDVFGEFSVCYNHQNSSNLNFNELALIIKETGLNILCNKHNIIEISPPGTSYLKPSHSQHNEFISAYKLGQDSSHNVFIAFTLLSFLNKKSDYKYIYIDTSAINYIVLSIINLVNRIDKTINFNPIYVSFHSYSGLVKLKPQLTDDVLVLISASTSNSLMDKVIAKWGVNPVQVITLLSFKNSSQVLHYLKNTKKQIPKHTENFVRRVDEYFTTEYLPPKSVVLKTTHGKNIHKWPFEHFFNTNNLKCHFKANNLERIKEQSIDLKNLPKSINDDIDKWVHHIISWHIPSSIKYIVTDESNDFCKSVVSKIQHSHPDIDVLDFNSVIDKDFDNSNNALCAILPVIRSGNAFISLNRDLRITKHNGMRIFISPFLLYQGESNKKQFKNSLLYGPDLNKYKFFNKYELNIPYRSNESSWESEIDFYDNLDDSDSFINTRKEMIHKTSEGLEGIIGLNGRCLNEHLTFSRHFAFWNFEYETQTPESVYFTVSSILQNARDDLTLPLEDQLLCNIQQQSVLSPENFVRFNDPLIQSCLWRAALDTEVDYSSDEVISKQFTDILIRLLKHYDNTKGEAAIDLLLGISIRKIRISNRCYKKLYLYLESFTFSHSSLLLEVMKEKIQSFYT
jgi:hypothetical protein